MKGKTVSRLLTTEEALLYKEWISNRKRLNQTVKEMLEVSREVAAILLCQADKEPFIPGR